MTTTLEKALTATRESKFIEFKQEWKVTSDQDWCEIIKDIAALANSGGGILFIGVNNRGVPTGFDVQPILAIDIADITNKMLRYTSTNFSDIDINEHTKNSIQIASLFIGAADTPIVFTKPGTYSIGDGRQRTAFSQGTIYFRHGAKSEPASSDDLRIFVERKVNAIRKEWMHGVKKVVTAPQGSTVSMIPREVRQTGSATAFPIRIVDDPNAPAYRNVDPNTTHPFRQKDVIQKIKERIPECGRFTAHDALAIRRLFNIDGNPRYYHKPRFGSAQYSPEYVEWLEGEIRSNPSFIEECRSRFSTIPTVRQAGA